MKTRGGGVDIRKCESSPVRLRVILLILCGSLSLAVGSTTNILQQGTGGYSGATDSWTDYDYKTTNHGSDPELQFLYQAGIDELMYFRFELDGVLPAHRLIRAATLSLYYINDQMMSGKTDAVGLNPWRLTASWHEGSVTFRDRTNGVTWTASNGGWNDKVHDGGTTNWIQTADGTNIFAVKPGNWVEFTVTTSVSNWYYGFAPNYGFLIGPVYYNDDPAGGFFASKEHGATAWRPKLTIIHESTPITWNTTSGSWDTNSLHWTWIGGATRFVPGDDVRFSDSGGGTSASVTVTAGGVSPSSTWISNLTKSYLFQGGSIGGSGGLRKLGTGTVTLSNANSYAGATVISQGTLIVAANNALGTTANGTVVSNGATLAFLGNVAYSAAEPLTVSGTGAGGLGALRSLAATNSFAGPVTLAGPTTVAVEQDSSLSLSGLLSGAHLLVKTGPGTLSLDGSSPNTYSGSTILSNGILAVGKNHALGTGAVTFHGGVLGATDGTWTITNTLNLAATGTVDIAGGTLMLSGPITNHGALLKVGAGTLALSGTNTYRGGTVISNGTLSIQADHNLGASDGPLTLSGGTLNTTNSFTLSRPVSVHSAGGTLLVAPATTLTVSNVLSGPGTLSKLGNGRLALSGANSFHGEFSLQNGEVVIHHPGALGNATVKLSSDNPLDPACLLFATSGSFSNQIEVSALFGTNIVGTLAAAGEVSLHGKCVLNSPLVVTAAAASRLTFEAPLLQGTGKSPLTKTGEGTLNLATSNTYRGGTRVLEGTLLANNEAGSATGSGAVEVSPHATLGGTGRITGAVTLDNQAVLAPGNSAGTLTLGSLTLNENSLLQFDLDVPNVIGGGINDLIVLSGPLVLDGILHVTAGPHFGEGAYTLFSGPGLVEDHGLEFGSLPDGFDYALDLSDPTQVRLLVTWIPEPSATLLIGVGTLLTLLRRRIH